jgi:hypothetical protein
MVSVNKLLFEKIMALSMLAAVENPVRYNSSSCLNQQNNQRLFPHTPVKSFSRPVKIIYKPLPWRMLFPVCFSRYFQNLFE